MRPHPTSYHSPFGPRRRATRDQNAVERVKIGRKIERLQRFVDSCDEVTSHGLVDDAHVWGIRCDVVTEIANLKAAILNYEREALITSLPMGPVDVGVDLFSTAPPPVLPLPRTPERPPPCSIPASPP